MQTKQFFLFYFTAANWKKLVIIINIPGRQKVLCVWDFDMCFRLAIFWLFRSSDELTTGRSSAHVYAHTISAFIGANREIVEIVI